MLLVLRRYRLPGASAHVLALSLLCAAGPAAAEVFRCEWPDGSTAYTDTACPEGAVVAQEISQQVGACVTEACEARRRAQAQAAHDRLREDKVELARMQELRIRQEEAWAQIIAARQAAEVAAYAQPPEEVVVAVYPVWLPHKHFRHHRHHCRSDKGCPPSAVPRAKHAEHPVRRPGLKRRAAPLRVALDR